MAGLVLSLAVTSSTAVVAVAVGHLGAGADAVVARVATDRRHAEELTPMIDRVLDTAGVGVAELDRFVVDIGPGRFTGLRVGLATVRALALAVDRPVVGLTSLEILAAAERRRPVVAVVDARRAEVFQQVFAGADADAGDGDDRAAGAVVGRPEDLVAATVGSAAIVGDGADRYRDLYGPAVVDGREPSPAVMLDLAAGRVARPGPEVTPVYLREPDVTVNVTTRHTAR